MQAHGKVKKVNHDCHEQVTFRQVPTELMSSCTVSAFSCEALLPRHMAEAVSPTRQGVFGMTLISGTSLPAASCNLHGPTMLVCFGHLLFPCLKITEKGQMQSGFVQHAPLAFTLGRTAVLPPLFSATAHACQQLSSMLN